jgi:hypothetical protein
VKKSEQTKGEQMPKKKVVKKAVKKAVKKTAGYTPKYTIYTTPNGRLEYKLWIEGMKLNFQII